MYLQQSALEGEEWRALLASRVSGVSPLATSHSVPSLVGGQGCGCCVGNLKEESHGRAGVHPSQEPGVGTSEWTRQKRRSEK